MQAVAAAAPLLWLALILGLAGAARGQAQEPALPTAPAEGTADEAPLFHSAEGGFAARFPGVPLQDEAHRTTLLGALRTRGWQVERGALLTRVARHDVPALGLVVLGAEALLERAVRDLLEETRARDPRAEPASYRGHPGRHLRYEPGDRPGEIEDAWLYLLGRRLYIVFARSGDPETAAAAARFAASVELLDDGGRSAPSSKPQPPSRTSSAPDSAMVPTR